MDDDRPALSAKEKRKEQLKRWENSATDLECGTYVNPKIKVKFDDGAVFLAACSSGDLVEVEKLLKRGADINFANIDGLTALHQACIDGNIEVVEFLVKNGSEIDQEDNEGWTPLHATASCGFMDIAKFLVDNGANVGAVNSEGELPIDTAEEDDMIDYLQKEIERQGIDVEEARNIERYVMLDDANQMLNTYQKGEQGEIYRHPKSGATALHITAAKGYNDVLKILMKCGIDVNVQDNDGWTPLHAASHWSQEESAKILSDKGANFKARSKLGQTPFDVADEDMLEYLNKLQKEQEINKPSIKESQIIEDSPSTEGRGYDKSNRIKDIGLLNGENEKALESTGRRKNYEQLDSDVKETNLSQETNNLPATTKKYDFSSLQRNERISTSNDTSQDTSQPKGFQSRSASESSGSIKKPIAATQPVQSVTRTGITENGAKSSSYGFTSKDSPASWRSGLRKTSSFEDKSSAVIQNASTDVENSTKFKDTPVKTDNARLARVAPILDARRSKSGSALDNLTTSDNSEINSQASGEKASDKISEASKTADKRRSHLQPVRDEEAEAQRRARSRRERQTRRSTQGVTLDVVEEAMRTIGKMRQPQSADKTVDASGDGMQRDSFSSRRPESDIVNTSSGQSASAGVTSLPSGYIPSDQRWSSAVPNIPNIALNDAPEFEADKATCGETENDLNPYTVGKSAAYQRRRNRKERRSTGLPDLKPTAGAEIDADEDETEDKLDNQPFLNADKLRETSARYDATSLPDRHNRHRPLFGSSDSDIPLKMSQNSERNLGKDYKELYEKNKIENEQLRTQLSEAQKKMDELQARLDRSEDTSYRRQALENEKRERRALERKVEEMEKELQEQNAEDLRLINGKLKSENTALVRIVEKLGGNMKDEESENSAETVSSDSDPTRRNRLRKKSESFPDLKVIEESLKNVEDKSRNGRTASKNNNYEERRSSLTNSLSDTKRTASTPKSEKYSSYSRSTFVPERSNSKHLLHSSSSDRNSLRSSYSSRKDPISSSSLYSPSSSTRLYHTLPSSTTSRSIRSTPSPYSSSYSRNPSSSVTSSRTRPFSTPSNLLRSSKPSTYSKYSTSSGVSSPRRNVKY